MIEKFQLCVKLVEYVERDVHKTLAHARLSGEWFDVPPIDALKTVRASIPKCEVECQNQKAFANAQQQPDNTTKTRVRRLVEPEIFVVEAEIKRQVALDEYARIEYEKEASKRALVTRLVEGKRKKSKTKHDIEVLNAWLSANR